MQHTGFSLPEVMIALLLVSLSASALISTMVTTRIQTASNANFSTAFRLSVELSDWVRQGGLKGPASDAVNPFDLIDQADSVSACFSEPCHAEAAALFYLHNWRRRLSLKVPNARIVVCQDIVLNSPASHNWPCDSTDSPVKARVIKIGWPQGSDGSKFPPRFVIALS
jgi:prepilin-type N-terminal cleavage/methylation domain-containing protein